MYVRDEPKNRKMYSCGVNELLWAFMSKRTMDDDGPHKTKESKKGDPLGRRTWQTFRGIAIFPLARSSVSSARNPSSPVPSRPIPSSIICQDEDAIIVFVWTTFGNDIARKFDFNVKREGGEDEWRERESIGGDIAAVVCVLIGDCNSRAATGGREQGRDFDRVTPF